MRPPRHGQRRPQKVLTVKLVAFDAMPSELRLTLSVIVTGFVSWLPGREIPAPPTRRLGGRAASQQPIPLLLRIDASFVPSTLRVGGSTDTLATSCTRPTVTALKYGLHKFPYDGYALPLQRQPSMQPRKVPRHHRAPKVASLGALSLALQRHGDMADLRLRFSVKNDCLHLQGLRALIVIGSARLCSLTLRVTALGFEGTVVNALLMPCAGQGVIDMLGPFFTPLTDERPIVPGSILVAETHLSNFPQREHDMGMLIARIAFVMRGVEGNIGNHATGDELTPDKAAHQLQLCRPLQLVGQRQLNLSAKLRITTLLDAFDRVPQGLTVKHPFRSVGRRHDFLMQDAAAPLIVVDLASALIGNAPTRTIGRRRRGRSTISAGNDLGR